MDSDFDFDCHSSLQVMGISSWTQLQKLKVAKFQKLKVNWWKEWEKYQATEFCRYDSPGWWKQCMQVKINHAKATEVEAKGGNSYIEDFLKHEGRMAKILGNQDNEMRKVDYCEKMPPGKLCTACDFGQVLGSPNIANVSKKCQTHTKCCAGRKIQAEYQNRQNVALVGRFRLDFRHITNVAFQGAPRSEPYRWDRWLLWRSYMLAGAGQLPLIPGGCLYGEWWSTPVHTHWHACSMCWKTQTSQAFQSTSTGRMAHPSSSLPPTWAQIEKRMNFEF